MFSRLTFQALPSERGKNTVIRLPVDMKAAVSLFVPVITPWFDIRYQSSTEGSRGATAAGWVVSGPVCKPKSYEWPSLARPDLHISHLNWWIKPANLENKDGKKTNTNLYNINCLSQEAWIERTGWLLKMGREHQNALT